MGPSLTRYKVGHCPTFWLGSSRRETCSPRGPAWACRIDAAADRDCCDDVTLSRRMVVGRAAVWCANGEQVSRGVTRNDKEKTKRKSRWKTWDNKDRDGKDRDGKRHPVGRAPPDVLAAVWAIPRGSSPALRTCVRNGLPEIPHAETEPAGSQPACPPTLYSLRLRFSSPTAPATIKVSMEGSGTV